MDHLSSDSVLQMVKYKSFKLKKSNGETRWQNRRTSSSPLRSTPKSQLSSEQPSKNPLEPTRKDLLPLKTGTTRGNHKETRVGGADARYNQIPYRLVGDPPTHTGWRVITPSRGSPTGEFRGPRHAPQPGGPAPGRRAPRAFGFEGQPGFIAGAPQD